MILAFLCVAIIGLCSTGCTGFDLLNAPVCGCGYLRTANIAYGDQPRQSLDVYRPRGAAANGRVVVFFYGGEWSAGKKADYRFAADALVSKGFVVVLPDYRLHPQVTFPAFVEDGAKAVRWTHDNISRFGGDPTHIYLMGHSAGAQIAALLTLDRHYLADVGLDTSVIRGTAGLSGPYYFFPS
ncbi:MAG TPA: alpha/beta hydrolase, partial [Humisphaera sp.]|nr:alpha/beta hydrolase [Humisphaera sp.]